MEIHAKPRSDMRRSTVQYYYMVTIHKHQVLDVVQKNEIEATIFVLTMTYPSMIIINEAYETSGAYGQLHVHLIVRTSKPIRYTKLTKLQGFRIRYDRLKEQSDVHRAQVYVSKDQYQYIQP